MTHPVDTAAGKQLRRRREKLGFTRAQLGALVGVTGSQVERYENAENRMSASRIQEFANLLGVHPAYFFDIERTGIFRLMRDALRFYAEPEHYTPQSQNFQNASLVDFDGHGGRARSVLAKVEGVA